MITAIPLASGSSGNSVLVNVDGCKILLDAGLSYKCLAEKLSLNNVIPGQIHGIFVTHAHIDHLAGVPMMMQKHETPIYRPSEEVFPWDKPTFKTDKFVALPGGGSVLAIPASHDVPCCSFTVTDKRGNKLVYVTDTGTILCDSLPYMMGANILIIEMNHEETVLSNGNYNDFLKKRVVKTHLSNIQAVDLIELVTWSGLKYIVPWHLSENNNSEKFVLKRLAAIELNNTKITFGNCTCM